MIELKEGNYLHGIWFVNIPNGDFMACLFKDGTKNSKEVWRLRFRFRYYKGEEIFFGNDEKNWQETKSKDGSNKELKRAVKSISSVMKILGDEISFLKIEGDVHKFMEVVEKENPDWLHIRKLHPIPNES